MIKFLKQLLHKCTFEANAWHTRIACTSCGDIYIPKHYGE
jgi:hypothetical protein